MEKLLLDKRHNNTYTPFITKRRKLMPNLVQLKKNVPVVATLDMWKPLNVTHRAIMILINRYRSKIEELGGLVILNDRTSKTKGGRPIKFCFLNEEQATFLITLMRNSKTVVTFKLKLTKEFYKMRKTLILIATQQKNQQWIELRKTGKKTRKNETDIIKQFIEYATKQGSQNAKHYYSNISRMENQALFVLTQKFKNLRNVLDLNQLSVVNVADNIVQKTLKEGMQDKLFYKDIYILAKENIETFTQIHGKSIVPAPLKQVENNNENTHLQTI